MVTKGQGQLHRTNSSYLKTEQEQSFFLNLLLPHNLTNTYNTIFIQHSEEPMNCNSQINQKGWQTSHKMGKIEMQQNYETRL